MTGKIKTLRADKGFGFIKDDGSKEYFFHQSAIYGEGIDMLRVGNSVEYTLGLDGPKGPRAKTSGALPHSEDAHALEAARGFAAGEKCLITSLRLPNIWAPTSTSSLAGF